MSNPTRLMIISGLTSSTVDLCFRIIDGVDNGSLDATLVENYLTLALQKCNVMADGGNFGATVKRIIQASAEACFVEPEKMYQKICDKDVSKAKKIAMYLIKKTYPDESYLKIGKRLGQSDHSTAARNFKEVSVRYNVDNDYRNFVIGISIQAGL